MRAYLRMFVCVVVLLLTGRGSAAAAALVLASADGLGNYDYAIALEPNETIDFDAGDTITLSGLTGVTAISRDDFFLTVGDFASCGFTSTTACFLSAGVDYTTALGTAALVGTLRVTSTVLALGPVAYTIETATDDLSGTVRGPAGQVPEPGICLLLVGGLVAARCRRRRSAPSREMDSPR